MISIMRLTVVNPFPSLSTVTIKEADAGDNAGQLLHLLLLVQLAESHERAQFCLWEHTLQSSYVCVHVCKLHVCKLHV